MRTRSILLARIGLLAGSICSILVLAELGLRFVLPVEEGAHSNHRIPHPQRGWSLEANARYLNDVGTHSVEVAFNAEGWRDIEHRFEKPEGTIRIVVLGDSFMEAYSVALEASFARRLESQLTTRGLPVEVINLSVGGYGTLQELITYRTQARRYAPDWIVLGFYENDPQNNLYELERAVTGNLLKTRSRPFLAEGPGFEIELPDHADVVERFAHKRAEQDRFFARLYDGSRLRKQIERAVDRVAIAIRRARDSIEKRAGVRPTDRRSGLTIDECRELYGRAWIATERILEQLSSEIEADEAKLLVFSVPAMKAVEIRSAAELPMRTSTHCLDPEVGTSPLAEVVDRLSIDFVDLHRAFAHEAAGDATKLFHASDRHWNDAGHRVASEVVAAFLAPRMGHFPDRS